MTTTQVAEVTANEVREWAANKGFEVGQRGRLSTEVIETFNRRHRRKQYTVPNTGRRGNKETS